MIVKSILDTDLYKFTTSYAYMKLFPQARGTFEFFDRDLTEYPEDFVQKVYLELSNLGMLRLTNSELDYMTSNCRFVPQVYWEWLYSFRFNSGKVQVWLDDKKHLHVTDYLYKVTLYEVPILAIISELRNRVLGNNCDMSEVIKKLEPKLRLSNVAGIKFSEFGTRRRFSYNVQDEVVSAIKEGSIYCTGTSNCYLAMKYEMPMMGTHPHEWFMFHGAIYNSCKLVPTDGLGISNSDLDQIGAKDYATVDDILSRFIPFENFRKSYDSAGQIMHPHDEMAESDCWSQLCARHGEDVVNKVWSRHLASEFKRKKAPIYISRELYE